MISLRSSMTNMAIKLNEIQKVTDLTRVTGST